MKIGRLLCAMNINNRILYQRIVIEKKEDDITLDTICKKCPYRLNKLTGNTDCMARKLEISYHPAFNNYYYDIECYYSKSDSLKAVTI